MDAFGKASLDTLPATATNANGFLSSITGTLNKTFDTALDVAALIGAQKLVGSVYPTGQVNPAALTAAQQAALQNQNGTAISPNTLLIVGGLLAAGVVAVLVLRR